MFGKIVFWQLSVGIFLRLLYSRRILYFGGASRITFLWKHTFTIAIFRKTAVKVFFIFSYVISCVTLISSVILRLVIDTRNNLFYLRRGVFWILLSFLSIFKRDPSGCCFFCGRSRFNRRSIGSVFSRWCIIGDSILWWCWHNWRLKAQGNRRLVAGVSGIITVSLETVIPTSV